MHTDLIASSFRAACPQLREVLRTTNRLDFSTAITQLREHQDATLEALSDVDKSATHLDDLFVLERYFDLVGHYVLTWQRILASEFGAAWSSLQDALDVLRLIRRFSQIDTGRFESQLLGLETTFPYEIFFSMGGLYEGADCSICKIDIDSESCPHRPGELYAGRLAQRIPRGPIEVDHLAVVKSPADKRCVVVYEDASEQFKVVRHLADGLRTEKFRLLDFGGTDRRTRRVPIDGTNKSERNARCPCGSNKKFKLCCSLNGFYELPHIDIVARRHLPSAFIV